MYIVVRNKCLVMFEKARFSNASDHESSRPQTPAFRVGEGTCCPPGRETGKQQQQVIACH
jgi:hypothetical protein